ncbi:MAG: glycosyl transferase [Chthoniobacterales bacterium]|nr:MAG: glycosyl transferase [Chthoniobacterales bacterium]
MMILHPAPAQSDFDRHAGANKSAQTSDTPSVQSLSIIIPVLNEGAGIRSFLEKLRARAPGAEIIVVDGGSSDATRETAEPFCDRVISSARGRASQMNTGAGVARGNVLWFLHADVEAPARCASYIEHALKDGRAVGGYFRIRLPRRQVVYRLTDGFAHYAGKLLRIRCGDHGLFCRRSVFERTGGFRDVPLMEDVEFFRALLRCGRTPAVPARLIVSPRRYEAVGPLRLTFAYGLIATLYVFRAPWSMLARLYQQLCA